MADGYVKVPQTAAEADGLAKKIDNTELVVGGATVERQRAHIAGAGATQLADVLTSSPAGTEGGLVVRNIPSGTQPVSGPLTDTQLRASAVPVSGTVTASGPLTDTQLRASAVPVSGPLTDTQLRATPVPVSGTVTASGPLTDTQLRATPVPVSGTVTTSPPSNASTNVAQFGGSAVATGTGVGGAGIPRVTLSSDSSLAANQSVNNAQWIGSAAPTVGQKAMASSLPVVVASDQSAVPVSGTVSTKTALTGSAPAAASVGVASAAAVTANANRKGLVLVNTSDNVISLAFAAPAVLNSGITLMPGGGSWTMGEYTFTTAEVRAIAAAAASNLAIQEFV